MIVNDINITYNTIIYLVGEGWGKWGEFQFLRLLVKVARVPPARKV